MSAVVYPDPYKLPAGILALLVHIAFFTLLYFGFSWQTQPPEIMSPESRSVELWQSLPDTAPPVPVHVEKVIPPPAKVEEVIKPDIVIPDKKPEKKVEVKPAVKPPEKPPEKPKVKPVEKMVEKTKLKPVVAKTTEATSAKSAQPSAEDQQAARERSAQETEIGIYKGKISAKIRSNVVKPPDVADDARAEFLVTVLPGGHVMNPRLLKSSGNAAYDNAVERAILKSDPLPLPADVGLFNQFRELKLGFKPVE